MSKPKLIVFDLDYTLWPFWVDTHVDPPFRKEKDGNVYDRHHVKVRHYEDARPILEWVHELGIRMAVASRTTEIEGAKQLLALLDWNKFFVQKEIYPGAKVNHFTRFKDKQCVEFSEMIFFDDEHRNIVDISKLGVMCVHVPRGMSFPILEKAMQDYIRHHKSHHKNVKS
ncbi:PREDICTED: magnesium-dependent phosphatase 1-like [Priapulus caudatus]|uniref:Magnesium-dependent phosphatase 1-like n=1 Tax=Priapulus caudatus TaxID=37621 RepID=A0ABM1FC65_PRICU|nr:PREDICTED: magnesium-dependent phosphatase 1-like [Priapulus caudatus]